MSGADACEIEEHFNAVHIDTLLASNIDTLAKAQLDPDHSLAAEIAAFR